MGFSLYARQQFSYILNLRSNMQTNGKETDKKQIRYQYLDKSIQT